MKNLVFSVVMLLSVAASAQEEVQYRQAYDIPLAKQQLSTNAVMYVSRVVGPPKEYIQHHDTTAGKLLLTGVETAHRVAGKNMRIMYSAVIDYKEGKCRITFYDIKAREFNSKLEVYQPLASLTAAQAADYNAIFNRYFERFRTIMQTQDTL